MIEILTAKLNYKVLLLLVSSNTCQASNSVLQSELPPNSISKVQNSPWEGFRLSLTTFTFTPTPLCQMNMHAKVHFNVTGQPKIIGDSVQTFWQ